jgi:hypothetical protein
MAAEWSAFWRFVEGRPFVKMKESNKPPIFLSDKYCVIVLLLNCLVSSLSSFAFMS